MTVLAYHLVWTAYGTWLPNDPRGSGSKIVASELLRDLGPLHFGRRKKQPAPATVREFYREAESRLEFEILRFSAEQVHAIADGFAAAIAAHNYTCYACAILPDHVHVLIRKHRDRAEAMIRHLQRDSRLRLCETQCVPLEHPVWTSGGHRGFLDTCERINVVIRYIERNPAKSGLPDQRWPFISPYDGWCFAKRPE
jgi:REP element-mobilizing transposase RayT